MNITIFPTGKGGAESAVNYLLSDIDHAKKKRVVPPEILFGDPNTFTAIANATNRKHKYTSGVIAFRDGAESQAVTPEQIDTLIQAFRATFLPGLKVDENFADLWVMHRDKGNLELHFLLANTELVSTQQLNIHPPGKKNIEFFNTFVSVMNDNFGFPQVVPDPLKISLKPFEAKSPSSKKDKKAKQDLSSELHSHIVDGSVANRNQLIGLLRRRGIEIPKVGKDFITVRLPGAGKNTRLKGPLFTKDSDYAALVEEHYQSKVPKFLTPADAADQKAKLVSHIEARAAFNQHRYLTPRPGAKRANTTHTGPVCSLTEQRKAPKAMGQETLHESANNGIRSKLDKSLNKLKEQAVVPPPGVNPKAPHRVARAQQELEHAASNMPSMGSSAVGGLEAQIGGLSMQYHSLLLLLAGATGRRAMKLQAQIVALEQKLVALNLELERRVPAEKRRSLTLPMDSD